MSEISAAIERLRKRPVPDHGFAEVDMADVFAVLAEVERLRGEVDTWKAEADAIDAQLVAESTARKKAEAHEDRLRFERDDFEGRYETAHANYMHALKVIDRLERQ